MGAGRACALPARHGLCAEDRVRPGAGRLQRIDPAQPDRGARVRRARRRLSRAPGLPARHRRLQRGHRLDPEFAFAWFQRGFAYHALEEPDKAYDDYTQAIRWDPKYITSYLNRGIILYTRRGDFEGAIADFTNALRLGPDNINALMHRGAPRAATAIRQGLRRPQPGDRAVAGVRARLLLSRLLFSMRGSADRALADYTTALRSTPRAPRPMSRAPAIYAQIGQQDKAIADLTRRSARPNAAGPYYNRGYSVLRQGPVRQGDRRLQRGDPAQSAPGGGLQQPLPDPRLVGKDLADALRDCDEALKLRQATWTRATRAASSYLKLGDFPVRSTNTTLRCRSIPTVPGRCMAAAWRRRRAATSSGGSADMAAREARAESRRGLRTPRHEVTGRRGSVGPSSSTSWRQREGRGVTLPTGWRASSTIRPATRPRAEDVLV